MWCIVVYAAVFLSLANLPASPFFQPILARFWMQPYQPVCILMAAGLQALAQSLSSAVPAVVSEHPTLAGVRGVACVSLLGLMIGLRFQDNDNSHNSVVHDMAVSTLASIPRGGIVLCTGDLNYYPPLYLQASEARNPQPRTPNPHPEPLDSTPQRRNP